MAIVAEPKVAVTGDSAHNRVDQFQRRTAIRVDSPNADCVSGVHAREDEIPSVFRPDWVFIAIRRIGSELPGLLAVGFHNPDVPLAECRLGGITSGDRAGVRTGGESNGLR